MKRYLFQALFCMAVVAGLVSCNQTVEIDELTLPATASVVVDSTIQLVPVLTPPTDKAEINWLSSDTSIAVVKDGFVTGIKKGSAIITANVGNKVATCQLSVKEPFSQLNLELSYCGDDSVAVKLTSSIAKGFYFIGFADKAEFEKAKTEDVIQGALDTYKKTAAQNGVTLEYVLQYYGLYGTKIWSIRNLKAATDYVCYTFPINADTGEAGEVVALPVTTRPVQPSDMTFTFTYDEDKVLTITPSNNDPYVFISVSKESVDTTYKDDYESLLNDYIAYYTSMYSAYGMSFNPTRKGVYQYKSFATSKTISTGKYLMICVGYRAQTPNTKFYTYVVDYVAPEPEGEGDGEGEENPSPAAMRRAARAHARLPFTPLPMQPVE